jgi:hypothetical protein
MTYTKEQLISELGLSSAEPAQQEQLLQVFYSSLNMKLQMALADQINDEQLEALNAEIKKGDDAAAAWIDSNIPNAATIIEQETEAAVQDLKQKIKAITEG